MFKILTIISLLLLLGCDEKTQKDEKSNSIEKSIVSSTDEDKSTSIEEKSSIEFELNTIDGKKIDILEVENGLIFKGLEGKAIFLIFFGYRCPPCIKEIPVLIELTKEHKDLAVIAIEVQGYDNEELKAFGQRKNINYNLISSDGHMDFISYIQAKANWHGSIPFFLGLDKMGKVAIVHTGGIGKSALDGAYQDLINIK